MHRTMLTLNPFILCLGSLFSFTLGTGNGYFVKGKSCGTTVEIKRVNDAAKATGDSIDISISLWHFFSSAGCTILVNEDSVVDYLKQTVGRFRSEIILHQSIFDTFIFD